MSFEVRQGDCVEAMAAMPAGSVDAVVCDPPYGIRFMGKAWDAPGVAAVAVPGVDHTKTRERSGSMHAGEYDLSLTANQAYQRWCEEWARECLRVLKPGGHLLASCGTRTYHRMTSGIEDAGFEIRDTICWLYGSGFPKSLDVSKAIDKLDAAAERDGRAKRSQGWLREHLTPQQVNQATSTDMGHHLTTHPTQPFVPTPTMLDQLRPLLPAVPAWLEELVADRHVESQNMAAREVTGERDGTTMPGFAKIADGKPTSWEETLPHTEDAQRWEGWGTALKPSWEVVVCAAKPNPAGERDTIDASLCLLGNQIASLSPANPAVRPSKSSPAEHDAALLASAQWTADERSSTRDALCGQMDTSRFESAISLSLSTVSLWRRTLADLCELTSTFTTGTGSSTTTALETLKSSLSDLTPRTIIEDASRTGGFSFSALPAVRAFNGVESRLSATRELLAPAAATSASQGNSQAGDVKPNIEPVVVARKPLSGTVAATVTEHGTGALNVDGCRVEGNVQAGAGSTGFGADREDGYESGTGREYTNGGRWPANVVLSHMEECVPVGTRKVKTGTAHEPDGKPMERSIYGETGTLGRTEGYADADGTETVSAWRCHPDCPVRLLDEQTGERQAGRFPASQTTPGLFGIGRGEIAPERDLDAGGASRFFPTFKASPEDWDADGTPLTPDGSPPEPRRFQGSAPASGAGERFFYCAKSSRSERNAGLEGFEERQSQKWNEGGIKARREATAVSVANVHPTVKPISLMRWLVRLVTPPGGTCLDPFTGSGSTGCAAVLEGFDFIGLEREAEYVAIAEARIAWWHKHRGDGEASEILAAGEARDEVEATGQASLFDEAA